MIDHGKHNVLGVLINAIDYEAAIEQILEAARAQQPMAISALAVHGLMTGFLDPQHKYRLNRFHLLVPDGQPVRWALNWMYHTQLSQRVYGPELTWRLCKQLAQHKLPIYLYGSQPHVLDLFAQNLNKHFPSLEIVGKSPSLFRQTSAEEKQDIIEKIRGSGAKVTFVGLGCPRQEVWTYEYHQALSMPVLAVGAAFDFHAGVLKQAPTWLQDRGLEWAFRLVQEPKRLWKRYAQLNPLFLMHFLLQASHIRSYPTEQATPPQEEILYG